MNSRGCPGLFARLPEVCLKVCGDSPVVVLDCVGRLQDPLFPVESEQVAAAVESRQRQFRAGRSAARLALAQLGLPAGAIGRGPAGEPLWPEGIAGSISHAAGYAAAAVAPCTRFAGLGIDIESATPLASELGHLVLTPEEQTENRRLRDTGFDLYGKAVFCAKEALYKCVFPRYREILDFADVVVHLDVSAARFVAHPARRISAAREIARLGGYIVVVDDMIAAAAFVPAAD
jgi:4'-phosphopantetheinyl transferase EntD